MPGQNIDVGFVYPYLDNENVGNELYNLIQYLKNWSLIPTSIIASRDIDGFHYVEAEEWGELDFSETAHVNDTCRMIANMYNAIITVDSEFLGQPMTGILIMTDRNVKDAMGYYCIDMSIKGNQIIDGCDLMFYKKYEKQTNDRLNSVTNNLISFISDFYKHSKYSYAFCDAEAMMECTPEELLAKQNGVYSVEVIPIKDGAYEKLLVRKNSWNIDGFSQRYEPA